MGNHHMPTCPRFFVSSDPSTVAKTDLAGLSPDSSPRPGIFMMSYVLPSERPPFEDVDDLVRFNIQVG